MAYSALGRPTTWTSSFLGICSDFVALVKDLSVGNVFSTMEDAKQAVLDTMIAKRKGFAWLYAVATFLLFAFWCQEKDSSIKLDV